MEESLYSVLSHYLSSFRQWFADEVRPADPWWSQSTTENRSKSGSLHGACKAAQLVRGLLCSIPRTYILKARQCVHICNTRAGKARQKGSLEHSAQAAQPNE